MSRLGRWVRDRRAHREVATLRARVTGHWAAIGLDADWTPEHQSFFLAASRKRNGLAP